MNRIYVLLATAVVLICFAANSPAQRTSEITVAQISDTHLGDKHAPHAAENLRHAVEMINERHPDAVVLSGDIGENPEAWEQVRSILKKLKPPLYYTARCAQQRCRTISQGLGKDYYTFEVRASRLW
jgi:predicted MPP superfamily phosphohydrolase